MRWWSKTILLAIAIAMAIQSANAADTPKAPTSPKIDGTNSIESEDQQILAAIKSYRVKLVRITDQPFFVLPINYNSNPGITVLCAAPGPPDMAPKLKLTNTRIVFPRSPGIKKFNGDPHGSWWIHVYVTSEANGVMLTGKGSYPVGTIVLKEKFSDASGTKTELFTGMRKRPSGYNPDCGDWEFFLLDATAQAITARGKIESCMSCHSKYTASDHVTRIYLKSRDDKNMW